MAVLPANLIENNFSNLQTLSIELKWLWDTAIVTRILFWYHYSDTKLAGVTAIVIHYFVVSLL